MALFITSIEFTCILVLFLSGEEIKLLPTKCDMHQLREKCTWIPVVFKICKLSIHNDLLLESVVCDFVIRFIDIIIEIRFILDWEKFVWARACLWVHIGNSTELDTTYQDFYIDRLEYFNANSVDKRKIVLHYYLFIVSTMCIRGLWELCVGDLLYTLLDAANGKIAFASIQTAFLHVFQADCYSIFNPTFSSVKKCGQKIARESARKSYTQKHEQLYHNATFWYG